LRTNPSVSYCARFAVCDVCGSRLGGALELTVETSLGNEVSETHCECVVRGVYEWCWWEV
jgi:hypothetical protein